jgi:hypothetical protein
MLNIILRTVRGVTPYYEATIKSTKMEVFADRVEGYNDEDGHFEIHINNGYFLAGHLPCCVGWEDETACFDFCTAYSEGATNV